MATGPADGWCLRRPGRRRNPALDDAIQAAVVDVLAHDGYAGLTMETVAAVAGVSKATIYRRWPSKTELLVSVIQRASDESLAAVDTGCLRDDLVGLLTSLVHVLAGPGGTASRALLTASTVDAALGTAFREGPMARWSAAFDATFARAVTRGEVAPTAHRSLAAEIGSSIVLKRWLITDRPIDEALAAALVDELMLPLLAA